MRWLVAVLFLLSCNEEYENYMRLNKILPYLSSSIAPVDPLWDDLLVQYDFNTNKSDVISHPSPNNDTWDNVLHGYTTNLPNGRTTTGLNGKALLLNTTSDAYHIETGTSQFSFNSAGNDLPFSIELIFQVNALGQNKWIFGKRNATGDREYDAEIRSDNKIQFSVYTAGGVTNFLRIITVSTFTTGVWYHAVFRYDGSKTLAGLKLSINAVTQSTTSGGSGTYTGMTSYTTPFVLGNLNKNQFQAFQCTIDQFSVWGRYLTDLEVTELYNGGVPRQKISTPSNPNFFETKNVILHKNGNYIFATDTGTNLLWSSDGGVTYSTKSWGAQYSSNLPTKDYGVITARIFDNGDVMFCTAVAGYYSTDGLVNINSSSFIDKNGNPFVFHTPVSATFPGCYMYALNQNPRMEINGQECYAWGNYTNNGTGIGLGAAPVVVWITFDHGQTIQNIYMFGRNTSFRDDGTAGGGLTGNLLGDPANSIKARHIHSVSQIFDQDALMVCSGDEEGRDEIHWIRLDYNAGAWTPTMIIQDAIANTKYKSGHTEFYDGNCYWVSDATGPPIANGQRGLFVTAYANIGITETQLQDVTGGSGTASAELFTLCISPNTGKIAITASGTSYTDSIWIATNLGAGTLTRLVSTNSNLPGWTVLDSGYFVSRSSVLNNILPYKTIWIKD